MSVPLTRRATFPEHWPAPLLKASLPLSLRDVQVLGGQSRSFREAMGDWHRDGFFEASFTVIAEVPTDFAAGVFAHRLLQLEGLDARIAWGSKVPFILWTS